MRCALGRGVFFVIICRIVCLVEAPELWYYLVNQFLSILYSVYSYF